MEEIIIGFSRPRNNKFALYSWLIRQIEKTEYSHVYIKWHSRFVDRYVIYQASGSIVHFIGNERFKKKSEPVEEYAIEIPKESKQRLVQWCMDQAGVGYGTRHVIGMGIVRIVKVFGKNIKNPLSGKEQVCSKLAGQALRDVLNIDIRQDLENAGPRMINEIVSSLPNAVKLDPSEIKGVSANPALIRWKYMHEIPNVQNLSVKELRHKVKTAHDPFKGSQNR